MMNHAGVVALTGRLRVWREDGSLMVDSRNLVVTAGLEAIVAKLIAAGSINTFNFVAFGTGVAETVAGDTALGTELSGGTYARLAGTQGEGATANVYRVTGTWTNNSNSDPAVVTEYGLFSAASVGTMLCRVSTGDTPPASSKTVDVGETISVQWDLTLSAA